MQLPRNPVQVRALQILDNVWGQPNVIGANDLKFLAEHSRPEENALQTCARVAHVNVQGVDAFDHNTIRLLCRSAEVLPRKTPYPAY